VQSVLPQWAKESLRERLGVMVRVLPVQARRAFRWAIFQSVVPVRWRTATEVVGDCGEMRAVMGVVVVRRW
jgi:hypothetical protein